MAGLYIHIPYCHSKCSYCDFYSTPRTGDMETYIDSLIREFDLRRDELTQTVTTVYIGGGTPSILPERLLIRLIDGLGQRIDIHSLKEFTIEANPEDITPQWLACATDAGIDRISMGIQSFNDSELQAVNRRHDAATAIHAVSLISHAVRRYSCDLIYGLPGQTIDSWLASLKRLTDLRPPHISAYLLSYEPGTRLYAQLIAGKVTEATDETAATMYAILTDAMRNAGYRHYEISNFALPGMEAIHNSAYWDSTPYLGLGVSAHSFDGNIRSYNANSITQYISAITDGRRYAVTEPETITERFNDYIITRLRTSAGIDIADLRRRWPDTLASRLLSETRHHLDAGRLISDSGRLYIPERHLLTADTILRDLIVID